MVFPDAFKKAWAQIAETRADTSRLLTSGVLIYSRRAGEASDLGCRCCKVLSCYLWDDRVSLNYHKPLFASAKRDLSTFPLLPPKKKRDYFSSREYIICKLNINEEIFDGSATILMASEKKHKGGSSKFDYVFNNLNFYTENLQMF